jgi:hypothetical protein
MMRTSEVMMLGTPRTVSAATLVLGVLVLSTSCSTPTQVTAAWRDPSYNGGGFKNLVVFGRNLDDAQRHTLEDSFASALQAHGVRATPSYRVFPGALPPRDEAKTAIQQGGYDGVLASTLKGINEKSYVEGAPGGFWDGYDGWGAGGAYVVTEPVVHFVSTLWDVQGAGKTVWTVTTKTSNPSSASDFASSLTNEVVPDLIKGGLVVPTGGMPVSQATIP